MNNKSGDKPEAEKENANANGLIEELAKYDEVLIIRRLPLWILTLMMGWR